MFMTDTSDTIIYNLFEFKPRKGDLKKFEITKAAIECLSELGVEKTTFESIAKKIGTRRAHVAYHFSDKHKIYLSAIKYVFATYQHKVSEQVDLGVGGKDKLEKYVQACFSWLSEHPEQVTVYMLMFYLCSLHNEFTDFYHQVRESELERLRYIVRTYYSDQFDSERIDFICKTILNTITSEMMIIVTTKGKVVEKGLKNSLSTVDFLL